MAKIRTIINKQELKRYILERLQDMRPGWDATRIATDVAGKAEASLKVVIDNHIHRHPTLGKTFHWD